MENMKYYYRSDAWNFKILSQSFGYISNAEAVSTEHEKSNIIVGVNESEK